VVGDHHRREIELADVIQVIRLISAHDIAVRVIVIHVIVAPGGVPSAPARGLPGGLGSAP
jgi:hypothetical protein